MAEAAVVLAVEKLGDLLIQKMGFLQGVEGKVKSLKDALKRMQCFLKDAAKKQTNDERIRNWISEIREVAQDAEDVIETFILKVDNPRSSRSGLLRRLVYFPNHVYHLNRVGEEIESIRKRLQDIERSCQLFGIQDVGERVDSYRRSEDVEWRHRLPPWQKDKDVVGLEQDVELLLGKAILDEREGLSITTIIGMGGIGKSTLARMVYNHAAVTERFDSRAWVVVSTEFRPREIIKELILQLLKPTEDKLKVLETMEILEMPNLRQMLHERLQGTRYFIVLDDVWEYAHWEALATALPDEDKASRLLFTSRNRDISVSARYVHAMRILDPNKSWELFLKKAFINNTDGNCPQELENIGREILKNCNGLPLAVTVVGGLLVKQRPSKSEWEKVLKGMNSHLGSRNSVSAILELSYHNLPPQLKSCFLCLGFFKEDTTIRAEKLVHIWIAQGLIPLPQEAEETMEEIARSYLYELINRNMVQVKDMTKDDGIKNCQIHDLIRELAITKAKEEMSFEILRGEGNSQFSYKPRHRAMYCSRGTFMDSTDQNKHLRSLFVHGKGQYVYGSPSSSYWKSFELLRILDFEDFGLKELPEGIGALIGLRYLGLRNNKIRRLPLSLGRLKNLEVLDIALNFIVEVPNVIWKMDSLRHLYMSGIRCKVPFKIDMKNLQTLLHIPAVYWKPKHMTSLQKLGIELDENSDARELCKSLAEVKNLVYLNLRGSYKQSMASLDGLDILHRLTRLKLQGWLTTLPSASGFPPNLSCLSLVQTYLNVDPMPILEKLKELKYLKLHQAYIGNKMVISNDGFPRLKVLSLRQLMELSDLEVGIGAMQELQRLEINLCPHLESLPEQVGSMSQLQELKMVTTKEIASKLRGVDSYKISNIQSVNLVGY